MQDVGLSISSIGPAAWRTSYQHQSSVEECIPNASREVLEELFRQFSFVILLVIMGTGSIPSECFSQYSAARAASSGENDNKLSSMVPTELRDNCCLIALWLNETGSKRLLWYFASRFVLFWTKKASTCTRTHIQAEATANGSKGVSKSFTPSTSQTLSYDGAQCDSRSRQGRLTIGAFQRALNMTFRLVPKWSYSRCTLKSQHAVLGAAHNIDQLPINCMMVPLVARWLACK